MVPNHSLKRLLTKQSSDQALVLDFRRPRHVMQPEILENSLVAEIHPQDLFERGLNESCNLDNAYDQAAQHQTATKSQGSAKR